MKKNLYATRRWLNRMLILSVSFLMGSMLYAQDLSAGLDYHFTFDSEDGGVVSSVVGNAGGTLTDGAVIGVRDGLNVLSLSGGSAGTTSPYFSFEDAVGTTLHSYTDFSISCWAYINSISTWARVFDFGSGTSYYMFFAVSQGSYPRFAFKDGGSEQTINGSGALPTGSWVHLVITLEGSVGRMYVNGEVAGENTGFTLNPSLISEAFTQNYIGKSMWSDPFFDGDIADFRIYNRALTEDEILALGSDAELVAQQSALDLGDLSNVTSDLTLPTTAGTDVNISWSINDTSYIDTLGHILQYPVAYRIPVVLTATLERTVGEFTYQLSKTFIAYLNPTSPGADLVAEWDFSGETIEDDGVTINDISGNGFVGTLENEAWIRTIGKTTQYDVLDMGEGTGYFDMSEALGEQIYQLGEYTISVFFRVHEDYSSISDYGNFFWSFCNTEDIYDGGGAMYFIGRDMEEDIMPTWYTTNQSTGSQGNAPTGEWHHLAYVQEATTGTVYLDGEILSQSSITYFPYSTIKKDSLDGEPATGTPFNWLGRSPYPSDAYLQNTAMYDFSLYSIPLSQDEIKLSSPFGIGLDVLTVVDELNAAWDEDDNAGFPEELNTELDALTLGDLSAVTSNITLPSQGSIDNTITISWSIAPALISSEGVVTRPDYLDTDVRLTATLKKGRYSVDTTFTATVLANEATKYTSDLLVHFDFKPENVEGNIVTDLSEQHFKGELLKGASIDTVRGITDNYGLLKLFGETSYFDMGDEVGKVIYALKGHFSISTYFYVPATKTNFTSAGNFLYAFSNSDSSTEKQNGYMFGRAPYTSYAIASEYWGTDQVSTTETSEQATQDEWHHYAYVQDDTLGIMYLDGVAVDTATITKWPNTDIPKPGLIGTNYNFLGRANFASDNYLAQAMMSDFRLYNKSLTVAEVEALAAVSDSEDGDLPVAYLMAKADGYIDRYSSVPTGDSIQYVYKGSTLDSLVVEGENIKWYGSASGVDVLELSEVLTIGNTYYASQTIDGYEGTERLAVLVKVKYYTGIDRNVVNEDDLRIDTSKPGLIRILDLKGDESVHVYNLVGRQMTVKNAESISVNPGIYIVKVNSKVKKVMVR